MFEDTQQKYVRLEEYDQIIIFPKIIEHSTFRHLNPKSAGFCRIGEDMIICNGESISLNLKSKTDDSYYATKQVFGYDAADALL